MIFRDVEPENSARYLNIALNAAIELKDNFKTALSYLELGDYYYNEKENKLALKNYYEAQNALGTSISTENKERISTRINDMKIKMDKREFDEITGEYDKIRPQ